VAYIFRTLRPLFLLKQKRHLLNGSDISWATPCHIFSETRLIAAQIFGVAWPLRSHAVRPCKALRGGFRKAKSYSK